MAIKYENSEKGSHENVNLEQPVVTKDTWWFQKFPARAFVTGGMVILLICVVIFLIILLLKPEIIANNNTHLETHSNTDKPLSVTYHDPDLNISATLPKKLNIISRREWLANPPSEKLDLLKLPVPYVIILHTSQENCSDIATCTFQVRQAQLFHMESRGWSDIAYSFLVGGGGNAYEGRGWKYVGAQVYGYNTKCIGIAFIGTFNEVMPPERQITAAKQLIEIGVKEGYIAEDYKLLAARQLVTTQSPGLLLYEDVKKWPHWTQTP